MLDESTKRFLRSMRNSGKPLYELTVEAARKRLKDTFSEHALPHTSIAEQFERTVSLPNGRFPVRVCRPYSAGDPLPVLLWFHGGGWSLGDAESMDSICRFVCASARVVVVNVDYRLAPEHKFPIGVEDCYASLLWVAANSKDLGADALRIAVSGTSAGGTLTIVTCLLQKSRGGPAIRFQAPIYPAFTLLEDHGYESRGKFGQGEYGLTENEIEWLRSCYFSSEQDALDFRASPKLFGDFRGLPPALVITAGYDALFDDGRDYAERLQQASVPVTHKRFDGTIHGFVEIPGALEAGKQALELLVRELRAHVHADETPL